MRETTKLEKLTTYFVKADTVALICHINPDSDTLGSALALRLALKKLGKTVGVFCDDNPPERLSFLKDINCINDDCGVKRFALAAAVDCSDADRFNVSGKYFKRAESRVTLDHHKTTRNFADYTVSVPEASATAELVFRIIKILESQSGRELMDYDIASLIFAGIVGDTGGFAFSNTTGETFLIASSLMEYKIPAHDIFFRLLRAQSMSRFKLKARVLQKAKFYDDGKIGIVTFTKEDFDETGTSQEYTEGVINEIVNIDDVVAAFAITEVNGRSFKVSIRTKAPVDASELSSVFGGGGHERASGCRLSGFYEDVVDKLLKAARDVM